MIDVLHVIDSRVDTFQPERLGYWSRGEFGTVEVLMGKQRPHGGEKVGEIIGPRVVEGLSQFTRLYFFNCLLENYFVLVRTAGVIGQGPGRCAIFIIKGLELIFCQVVGKEWATT